MKAGRLVVDEPTDLPEGTEIELLPLDPGDWLDEEDRGDLHQALKNSDEDVKAGRLVDAPRNLSTLSRSLQSCPELARRANAHQSAEPVACTSDGRRSTSITRSTITR